jgi:hypothetical protein
MKNTPLVQRMWQCAVVTALGCDTVAAVGAAHTQIGQTK